MNSATRACDKCGAEIVSDGPREFCSACVLEAGLGDFADDEQESSGVSSPRPLMEFGEYELLEEIGRGGQGVVYRARHKGLKRIVALKVIGLGHWATEAHLKRFRLEAEAAAQLDHPSIVPIYEVGDRDGACFFSMKFVEGGQLDTVACGTPMPSRAAAQLLAKIARTVHYAHEHGVLHRDIKPGNILLSADGEPHLTDFGLARLVEQESNVTRTMDVLGTPSYMAPEQAAGAKARLTNATDVYGLGAVLYHLLTGQPPFAGGTTFETVRQVLETEPRHPRLWNAKVDRELATICLKCLEKDPERRYASALALAEDLERWLRHEPIRARRSGVWTRGRKWIRRNPAVAAVTPVLLALTVLVAVMFWSRAPVQSTPTGIAVLPFEDLSGDTANAFFADGMQDDILTRLAKVADLKVISRSSVMAYRGERNVRKIGEALRVSHVLEGSVRKTDGTVRLNAQLIDTRSDTHVWAEHYEGAADEVFSMQTKIAQKVVRHLTSRMSAAENDALETKPTNDLQAYDLYLRGKQLFNEHLIDPRDTEAVARAVSSLEEAVARDPNFALAYCALAEASVYLSRVSPARRAEAKAKAEGALQAAQRLAPRAGETRLAHALFFYWGEQDQQRALDELDTAARSLPNSAEVFRLSALVERRLGRWSDSLRHLRKAVELDPRNALLREQLIQTNAFVRRYAEAMEGADQAIAVCPEKIEAFLLSKGRAALQQGDLATARASLHALPPREVLTVPKFILSFTLALYERNFAEAERVVLLRSQIPNHQMLVPDAYFEAVIARANGDGERAATKFREARARLEEQLRAAPNAGLWIATQALADAALGNREAALAGIARALEVTTDPLERPAILVDEANVSCWLGDHARALEQLEKLASQPLGLSPGDLQFNPAWDVLRDEALFQRLLTAAAVPITLQ